MKSGFPIRKPVQSITVDMSVSNVSNATWLQLDAALDYGVSGLEIFNPSGSAMILSQGTAGNETAGQLPYTILPGGISPPLQLELKAAARLAIKSLDTTVSSGRLILNLFQ